jgi:hypothetical protein
VPTNQPNDTSAWQYSQIGGSLLVNATAMPAQQQAWQQLDQLSLCNFGPFLTATHSCSYSCFLSQYVNSTARTECLLWEQDSQASNGTSAERSYCWGFPTTARGFGNESYPRRD